MHSGPETDGCHPSSEGAAGHGPASESLHHHHHKSTYTIPPDLSLQLASILPPPIPRILFALSKEGHDPTEMTVPWMYFKNECGWEVDFATETGELARCDQKLIEKGIFRKTLGASVEVVESYYEMVGSREFEATKKWAGERALNFTDYDAVFLPGGHDKSMIPYLKSESLHSKLASYVPLCVRRSADYAPPLNTPPRPPLVLGAICHGVLPLAFAKYPAGYADKHSGKPLLHNLTTTTLPQWMETAAWASSQLWRMGDYYYTFPGSYTEGLVLEALDDKEKQFKKGPMMFGEFVCVDEAYHYVSGRWPGDAKGLAKQLADEIIRAREGFVEEVRRGVWDQGSDEQ